MQCPVDGALLVITERQGVEIDYCPQCRGVWLDRGELDKIIDRAAFEAGPVPELQNPDPIVPTPPVKSATPEKAVRDETDRREVKKTTREDDDYRDRDDDRCDDGRYDRRSDRDDGKRGKKHKGYRKKKKNRVADFLEDIFDF
ncbi:MAG: zf-TFIIB domain-containing protein [Halocynthiibacter sp.]